MLSVLPQNPVSISHEYITRVSLNQAPWYSGVRIQNNYLSELVDEDFSNLVHRMPNVSQVIKGMGSISYFTGLTTGLGTGSLSTGSLLRSSLSTAITL
jgi:hypothetical protein